MDTNSLLKECRVALKKGDAEHALIRLRDSIRRGVLSPEQLERAGRIVARYVEQSGAPDFHVRILGQCTTSWLVPLLTTVGWGDHVALHVADGPYDNIVQELMAPGDLSSEIVVLLPWSRALLADSDRSLDDRVGEEMEIWRLAWSLLAERGGPRLVQVGYDWITPGALGGHLGSRFGDVALVRTMNEQMRVELPGEAAFVDLAEISGQMGRESFYDPRRDCWTRQPFSEAGAARLAEHLYAAVRAVTTGPKKALILDLDDTLWGGVVGDLGPLGIGLGESAEGEAYRTFQGEVSRLARRGIVLAVASKNNRHDAVEAFEKNPDMVLSLDDFAAFEACWDPKDQMIRRIAEHLGLGLEHLVFFDDNPAERELIRQALPEVSVVEVPEEPAEYVRALYRGLFFESCSLTADDLARTVRYRKERARRDLERSAPSMDAYLTSLEMRGVIRDIDDADMQRVVQLLGKTNQWNLTTRRLSHAEVCALLEQPGSLGLTLRLSDRFGDHGLVAVLLAVRDGDTLRISDWLMSCRVIGRTAEQLLFRRVLELARDAGVRFLEGEYRGTKKNGLVSALYSDLGFECSRQDGEQATYLLDLNGASPPQTFVRPE